MIKAQLSEMENIQIQMGVTLDEMADSIRMLMDMETLSYSQWRSSSGDKYRQTMQDLMSLLQTVFTTTSDCREKLDTAIKQYDAIETENNSALGSINYN